MTRASREPPQKNPWIDSIDSTTKLSFKPQKRLFKPAVDADLRGEFKELLKIAADGNFYDASKLKKHFEDVGYKSLCELIKKLREELKKVLEELDTRIEGKDVKMYVIDLKEFDNGLFAFVADGHGNDEELEFISDAIEKAIHSSRFANKKVLNPFNPRDLDALMDRVNNAIIVNVIILGDTMDRGNSSVWNLLIKLLLCVVSGCVVHQRGNHETRSMNEKYGFDNWIARLEKKFGGYGSDEIRSELTKTYEALSDCSEFRYQLSERYVKSSKDSTGSLFTCHGGLCDFNHTKNATAENVHWSDLCKGKNCKFGDVPHFNSERGVGQKFHEWDVVNNDFTNLLRGHTAVHGHKLSENSTCLTIHSSPHYGGFSERTGKAAAIFALGVQNNKIAEQFLVQTDGETGLNVKHLNFLKTFSQAEDDMAALSERQKTWTSRISRMLF